MISAISLASILLIMGITCLLLCQAFGKKAEELYCVVIFSVIVVLFPFYCMDILAVGRYVVYAALGITILVLTISLIRKHRFFGFKEGIIQTISPGIVIFAVLFGYYIVYLHGNLVELWDELRLWGATPKALYETESLQLGKDALIFPIMQPYPPAMPLFVYFLTALAPNFPEYQIFVVYAIFFSALILPALQELKWKQWPLFVGIGLIIVLIPCILTSHGGDHSYFYESLFIDPILGAMAGYVFYLSATKPFSSGFHLYRFSVALIVLTLLKDSGILFAVLALINAMTLQHIEGTQWKKGVLQAALAVIPMAVAYIAWKSALKAYGVSTYSSSHMNLLNFSAAGLYSLCKKLRQSPMVIIQEYLTFSELRLTFWPCLVGMASFVIWFTVKHKKQDIKTLFVSGSIMIGTFVAFLVGNMIAFGEELPSFQRYTCSLLFCLLEFIVLWVFPSACNLMKTEFRGKTHLIRIICFVIINVVLLSVVCNYMQVWRKNKLRISDEGFSEINYAVYQIKQNEINHENRSSDYYLLISEDMLMNSRIHHRIYFELLGTTACVRNFYHDTNIIGKMELPDEWTKEDVQNAANTWERKLAEEGFDYVYALSINEFTSSVLSEMGIAQADTGEIYAVVSHGDRTLLRRCN